MQWFCFFSHWRHCGCLAGGSCKGRSSVAPLFSSLAPAPPETGTLCWGVWHKISHLMRDKWLGFFHRNCYIQLTSSWEDCHPGSSSPVWGFGTNNVCIKALMAPGLVVWGDHRAGTSQAAANTSWQEENLSARLHKPKQRPETFPKPRGRHRSNFGIPHFPVSFPACCIIPCLFA